MNMANNYAGIERLSDNNYETWKLQMKSVLVYNDLWNFVIEKTEGTANKTTEWLSKDSKALALITLSVKENQLPYIKKATTAKVAWELLERVHASKGPARKVVLYRQLFVMKKGPGEPMTDHLRKFQQKLDELEGTGIEIPADLSAIMLLNSLPEDYENFCVAIETKDEMPSMDVLKVKLLEEETRRGREDSDDNVSAFITKREKINKYLKNKENKRSNEKFTGNCFNCGKSGHRAVDCWSKRKLGSSKKKDTIAMPVTAAAVQTHNGGVWYLDSGATAHICNDKEKFIKLNNKDSYIHQIYTAGEETVQVRGIGTVAMELKNNIIHLKNVIYAPKLKHNLISVSKISEKCFRVEFNKCRAKVMNSSGDIIFEAWKNNNLYLVKERKTISLYSEVEKRDNVLKWHRRLGHLNFYDMEKMSKKNLVTGIDSVLEKCNVKCVPCLKGKIKQIPYKSSRTVQKNTLDLIHSDICGPFNASLGGSKYFITFIDDKSRYVECFFLKTKSEAFNAFKIYKSRIECEINKKIKVLRTDNAKEYVSKEFEDFLKENGIIHQLSVPYTPQQNGVAERMNRTLVEMARTMLVEADVPKYLWAEAISTATFTRNRTPSSSIGDRTPYEIMKGRKPNINFFRAFGSRAIALNKRPGNRRKFDAKGSEYIFIGYDGRCKGYRLYDETAKRIIISRDVEIIETLAPQNYVWLDLKQSSELNKDDNLPKTSEKQLLGEKKEQQSENEKSQDEDTESDNILEETHSFNEEADSGEEAEEQDLMDYYKSENEIFESCEESYTKNNNGTPEKGKEESIYQPNSSKKAGRPKIIRTGKRGRPRKERNKDQVNFITHDINNNPISFENAINSEDKEKWTDAINVELASLERNKTWVITDRPKNKNILTNKWVFTKKFNKDESINKFKARLVARGCQQENGIDYNEIFAPVIRYETLRTLFAVSAKENLIVHHMDVITAFVQGDLEDELYMEIPEGLNISNKSKVCKLLKPLYGLKQASRQWHQKLSKYLIELGMCKSKADQCLYIKKDGHNKIIMAIYVDDLVLASNNKKYLTEIKLKLAKKFEMKDLGEICNVLGISVEINMGKGEIELNQRQYIQKLLKLYKMEESKIVLTPMECGFLSEINRAGITEIESNEMKNKPYRNLIGSLQYLAHTTRPDIGFAVNVLSRFAMNPSTLCWTAAKRVLKYLKGTIEYKINYRNNEENLVTYADSDWASDPQDRRSHSGYIVMICGGPISWKVKKQKSVSLSTMEAEYVALSEATKEVIYLRQVLTDMGINIEDSTTIRCDNQSCIQFAKDGGTHEKSKHIDIRYNFCKEKVDEGIIKIEYVSSDKNLADIMTKSLSKIKHKNCVNMLRL